MKNRSTTNRNNFRNEQRTLPASMVPEVELMEETQEHAGESFSIVIDQDDTQIEMVSSEVSLAIELPLIENQHYVCLDTGRRHCKSALIINPFRFRTDKQSNVLAIEAYSPETAPGNESGFISDQLAKMDDKDKVWVTHNNLVYSFGKRASLIGGESELGETKAKNILPRVLATLSYYKIMDGVVNLSVTIPYPGQQSEWNVQQSEVLESLSGDFTWTSLNGKHRVKIVPHVAPEGFYAARFTEIDEEELGEWRGLSIVGCDWGYQTFIVNVLNGEAFDPFQSKCLDGWGTSRFYGYVAEFAGLTSKSQDSSLIESVNKQLFTYEPIKTRVGRKTVDLSDAIEMASSRYLTELFALLDKIIPESAERVILSGGGAIRFGEAFKKYCEEWGEVYISTFPDIMNILAQAMLFPQKVNK